jgi:dTDP-4-dehydrorhamnose reductase
MRALITGGGGQLASDLQELLGDDARSFSHAELDIADSAALDRAFDDVQPNVVFNCAAFHNVDVCETEPDSAWAVNVRAVRDLAGRGAKLVHLSTNYVFDGRREEPYGEDDLPNPRSIYALTKLAGEYAALAYGDGALVVRGAGLYGLHGSASKGGNFVQRMVTRAREQRALKMVADQRRPRSVVGRRGERRRGGPPAPHRVRRVLVVRVHGGDHGARRDRRPDRAGTDHDRPRSARPPAQRRARAAARRRARAFRAAALARRAL